MVQRRNVELSAASQSKYQVLRTIIISNMTRVGSILALATAIFNADAAGAATNEYVVTVDEDMRRMQVEARFSMPVDNISARSSDARDFLSNARNCDNDEPLRLRWRRLRLPDEGLSCLHYTVDLVSAAAAERRNSSLSEANFIVSPAVWFWRPARRRGDETTVRFELPDSVNVSVPWVPVPGKSHTYRLQDSPESSTGFAAFGRFDFVETSIPGATLRITVMQPEHEIQSSQFVEWIRDTANNVVLAYGRFPNPAPTVIVLPVGDKNSWSDSPVPFGRVVRDGGETIELFVNQFRPIEDFYDSWTATHEFSHLMLPYIISRYRWVSEGFASYYQNVLLARAGQYSEQRAWQKLWEGFERGRKSRPELSANGAARAGIRAATMKIYWSGAAIALLADVELRRRSDGAESLDEVLDRLAQCCLPSDRAWTGPELFRKLDTLLEEPLFMTLYRQYANVPGFPRMRPVLENLGVDVNDDQVQLRSDAELAAIRSAIMQKP